MIKFSETETIELKESTSQTTKAIESIVAMLNKSGHAIVYFGVDNKGNPTKQTFSDKTILKLSQEITNNIFPHIIPTIQFINVSGFAIIKVEAFGNDQPYTAYDKYYIRSGTQNKKLLANEVKSLALSYMPNVIGEIKSSKDILESKTSKQIYSLILNNNEITIHELSIQSNKSVPCVTKTLKQLKDKGFIKRIGSRKSGYWKVNK